jgi:hypothetical protein
MKLRIHYKQIKILGISLQFIYLNILANAKIKIL